MSVHVSRFALIATLSLFTSHMAIAQTAQTGVWAGVPGSTMMHSDVEFTGSKSTGEVSPVAAEPLRQIHDALQAQNWAGAIAKSRNAETIPGLEPFDDFMIQYYLGVAYYHSGDIENAAQSYYTASQSPVAPAELRNSAVLSALQCEIESKHPDKVVALAKLADAAGIADEKVHDAGARAYYDLGDDADATGMANKAIADATKAGRAPAEMSYRLLLMAQARRKDNAGEFQTLDTLCNLYGDKDDWRSLTDMALGGLHGGGNDAALETAMLYIYRLRMIAGSAMESDDYLLVGQLALELNSPGDAQQAIQAGLGNGTLTGNAKARTLLAQADKRAATDKSIFQQAEATAAKSRSGNDSLSVGEAYFGYGRYADALRMAQAAIAKGGTRTAEATLLLGASQAMLGDNSASAASLAAVNGAATLKTAAHLWSLYASRKYGSVAASVAHS